MKTRRVSPINKLSRLMISLGWLVLVNPNPALSGTSECPLHLSQIATTAESDIPSESEVRASIQKWIYEVLDQPSKLLGGNKVCPFARGAWDKGLVDLRIHRGIHFTSFLDREVPTIEKEGLPGNTKIVLFVEPNPNLVSPEDMKNWIDEKRRQYKEQDLDLYPLFDHPEIKERLGKLKFNHGTYLLVFFQMRSELMRAGKELEDRKYFMNWKEAQKGSSTSLGFYDEVILKERAQNEGQ